MGKILGPDPADPSVLLSIADDVNNNKRRQAAKTNLCGSKSNTTQSKNKIIYQAWTNIQDEVGDVKCWPKHIRKFFWSKNLSHWDRCRATAFIFVNGKNLFYNQGLLIKFK